MLFRRLFALPLFLFLFSFFSAFAQDVYVPGVSEYFYEMWRHELCGNVNPEYIQENNIESFPLLKKSAGFFDTTFWTFEHGAIKLADYLVPEKCGLIQNTLREDALVDNGDWIKSLLRGASTDFVITRPEELDENMLAVQELAEQISQSENPDAFFEKIEDNGDEIPAVILEETVSSSERILRNSENQLVYHSFEDEFFAVQNIPESRIIVRGDNKNLYRLFYDKLLRVEKKEIWNYTKDIKTSEIKNCQTFKYQGNSSLPSSSELVEDNKKQTFKYDEKGRVSENCVYAVFKKYELLESKTTWKFTSTGKIAEKFSESYTYKKGKVRTLLSTESKKEVFMYKVDDKIPDYYYYEDNELRMKTVYSSNKNYVTTTYFDGGFTVENYFEADQRKKDIFYLNGDVKRIKVYEQ